MYEKICSVDNKGNITFIQGTLPEEVPKVKHPLRELNEEYANHLRSTIEERVKLKKEIIKLKLKNEKDLLEVERQRLRRYKKSIEVWFN